MMLYTTNRASLNDIYKHLVICDSNFVPPLSSRVNIMDYSQKIRNNAITIEAWHHKDLVGLIACYANDKAQKAAFITIVSVALNFQKRGIANHLMLNLLKKRGITIFKEIRLEVLVDNKAAISLYSKFGFKVEKQESSIISMVLVPSSFQYPQNPQRN